MIIGITGKIGSGKSTLSNILKEEHKFTEIAFADPLKQIASIFGYTHKQLYGTQEDKLEVNNNYGMSAREFLQTTGSLYRELSRKFKCKYGLWSDFAMNKILEYQKKGTTNIVISDVRYEDEYNMIKSMGGIIIKVVRHNDVTSSDKSELKHHSETTLDRLKYDVLIDNDKYDVDEVKKYVDNLLKYINI